MVDDECKHLLPAGQCSLCRPPPPGVLKQGWRTKGGRAYHNDRDCDWLRKGHNHAGRQGREVHDAVQVRWADATPGDLQPCGHCCRPSWLARHGKAAPVPAPPHIPAPEKECLVQADGEWWPGVLTWEPSKRQDGLWWASVKYRKADQQITEVRNQHELRAR